MSHGRTDEDLTKPRSSADLAAPPNQSSFSQEGVVCHCIVRVQLDQEQNDCFVGTKWLWPLLRRDHCDDGI